MRTNLFFLFFFFTNFIFSQNLDVKYDIDIKNLQDKNKIKTQGYLKSIFTQSQKDIKNYPLEFIINSNGYSIDFSNSLQVDPETQRKYVSKFMVLGFIGLDILVYNDGKISYTYNNGEIINSYDIENLGYWEITKEIKNILGYSCYKAYFKTDVPEVKRASLIMPKYAWFSTEIPIKGGPTIFGNLPGLILELETKVAHFKATSIQETDKKLKKINFKDKKIMTFIESERYHIDMMKHKLKN